MARIGCMVRNGKGSAAQVDDRGDPGMFQLLAVARYWVPDVARVGQGSE